MSRKRRNKVVNTPWIYSDCSEVPQNCISIREIRNNCSMSNESNDDREIVQAVEVTDEGPSLKPDSVDKERQRPEGGNEYFEVKTSNEPKSNAKFYVTPCGSSNGQVSMRRTASDNDINVDIEIEVDLSELGTDIREIIASMEKLKLELGDLGNQEYDEERKITISRNTSVKNGNDALRINNSIRNGRLVRKKSLEAEDINRWSDPARQISQNSSIASRKSKNTMSKPFRNIWKSNLSARRGYSSDENILRDKEILNVTSLVNENFDESRIFKSNVNGVDLGLVRSVSRNVDLSTKNLQNIGKNNNSRPPPRDRTPSPRYGGFDAIELYPPRENWRIFRNLITISLSFMVIYTAYYSTLYLQKAFNTQEDLRSWHIMVECMAGMAAATSLPTLVIKWIGSKWAMVTSCLFCVPYFITQFVPASVTILPTSALLGVGMAILWTAQGTYLTVMAEAYTVITDIPKDTVLMIFFGIFYFVFFTYTIWINLALSEVLINREDAYGVLGVNVTGCGAEYCPNNAVMAARTYTRIYSDEFIVWGILLGLVVVSAMIIAFGVDTLSRYNEGNRFDKTRKETDCHHLTESIKQIANPYQLLLVPLILLLRMSDVVHNLEFVTGYYSCVWQTPHFSDLLICYGAFLLVFCLLVGSFAVRMLGRIAVIVFSLCLFSTVLAVLKFWDPSDHKPVVFFIISAIWAITQSAVVVVSALPGVLFVGKEEQAYSNLVFWTFAGQLITYAIQGQVCMNSVLLILLVVLLISVAGYIAFEMTWKASPSNVSQRALSIASSDGMVEIPLGNPIK